jgi:hypothetical protein
MSRRLSKAKTQPMSPRLSARRRTSKAERATPPPLFGLASHGVFPADTIARAAVRSYRTFSPLLAGGADKRYLFCGTFRSSHLDESAPLSEAKTQIKREPPAVSRHAAL